MTDEQWVWLFCNESIDRDEQYENTCDDCKRDIASGVRQCVRCGKVLRNHTESFVNPHFDPDRFERLKNGQDETDYDLLSQVRGSGSIGRQENRD